MLAERLDQALEMISDGTADVLAGGTDYFPARTKGGPLPVIVDVSRVREMQGVTRTAAGWRIGGAATWSQIIKADLPPAFDGLKAAAREVGSVQIQNTGTIAGNLCNASPAADGVPCLLSLDAMVELSSANGTRAMPLADFLTGVRRTALQPGELLSAVTLPDPPAHAAGIFEKLGSRRYLVISITMVGVVIGVDADGRIDHARIAVGACSPVAQRQHQMEEAVLGTAAKDILITPDQLQNLSPIADVRGDADYRLIAACAQINRAIARAVPS